MKHSHLALISGLILIIILTMSWCGRNPAQVTGLATPSPAPIQTPRPTTVATPTLTPSPTASPTSTPSPTPTPTPGPSLTPSPELRKAAKKVGLAIISISVFDPSGQLLHTGTAFYISNDGRFLTNWHVIDGGAHAVAKSSDGKIRNVTGVLASSAAVDLAVLRAETKIGVPFLRLSKTSVPDTPVAVVESSMSHREQPVATVQVSAQHADPSGELFATSSPLSAQTSGAPLVDENGEVVGVVTLARDSSGASSVVVRPASALASLLAQIAPETAARWAGTEAESPSPTPSPKKLRIVSNPAPVYPQQARRANPPIGGSGRFRIVFGANGDAREVQVVRSTGQSILDQAAVEALHQWRSEPGREWSLVVPMTFRP
jgi:TonB family protein